jgi:tetratricopeptide (TPR) repeat protein
MTPAALPAQRSAIELRTPHMKLHMTQQPDSGENSGEMQTRVNLLDPDRIAESEAAAIALTKRFPENGFGWKLLGATLKLRGRHGEAFRAMHRAAELLPDDEEAQSNLGAALADANELQAAERVHRRALQINPRYAPAYSNLGGVLCRKGRLAEAEACHRQALAIQPDYAEGHNNLGSTLNDQGRIEEAVASYRRALEIKPDFAQAHWNESMCKLLLGNFTEGWKQYEWRRLVKPASFSRSELLERHFAQPQWLGSEPLQGKTILLHAEQGLGDTIQFCRYAALAADKGATVILQVPIALKALLTELAGVTYVAAEGETLPPFDFHCPLLSMPLAFGTRLASIPATIPYLFADPAKVGAWRDKLGTAGSLQSGLLRIGLAWAGNPLHRNDLNRSIPLADFLAIANGHGHGQAGFYCLQKELKPADRVLLDAHREIQYFGNDLHDFADTAALIDLMDLVITVDTAVAHLAAAMGKPVWILLPFQPDWRWLRDREDSPWYPTARLFRQPAMGAWESVLDKVRHALALRDG